MARMIINRVLVRLRHLGDPGGVQRRVMMPSKSYLSQTEAVITFGLGKDTQSFEVEILWPNGQQQIVSQIEPNQQIRIVQPTL